MRSSLRSSRAGTAMAWFMHALACLAVTMVFESAVSAQSITVTVIGTNPVAFAITPGAASNPGSGPTAIGTAATLGPGPPADLSLWAYFTDPAAALTYTSMCPGGGCPNIPSAAVEVSVDGGGFTRVNQSGPFAGTSSVLIWTQRLFGMRTITRHAILRFNINASTLPNLAAGNYSGTMIIQAQAVL